MTRHVILGGGPAGIHAIETIRQLDPEADLTLVCDEVPCARMVLPYHLAGTIQPGTLFTTDEAWAKDRGVTLEIGCRATSVDAEANEVVLDDGSVLAYDRLLPLDAVFGDRKTGSGPALFFHNHFAFDAPRLPHSR